MVHIEIDGKEIEVAQGQMIIEAADAVGIPIPRFCYHKKLSIAANCRMCLVDVANAPKPLPACATPVSEGMKIFTQSPRAIDAQKAVMEFLLINHPLDCPICDQGGQCELQDVALEYGKDYSRFHERKRVVKDKNIGPLISTDMTRCIHCTRCVRFGTEIAGQRELGATGRGEFMEIGTFVEKSVTSEMSGNVIDLCPVGALTSKPFRFKARAWELKAKSSISPHDCVGSNLFFHSYEDKVIRTLPRENENLNEVWLSDRDRFSYEGLNHPDRLKFPMIKRDNQWEAVDWYTALEFAVQGLKKITLGAGATQLGAILSPNCTVEEFYLAQKLMRDIGCPNIDHRLRQMDFSHQSRLGTLPGLNIALADLEQQQAILLVGADIRKEQPLINHRCRKAQLHGHAIFAINAWDCDFNFPLAEKIIGDKGDIIQPLLEVVKATVALSQPSFAFPKVLQQHLLNIEPSETAIRIAKALVQSQGKTSIILGMMSWMHPQSGILYTLTRFLAECVNATWGETSNGANSAGAWLAGAVPHRLSFGEKAQTKGLNTLEMWENPRQGYLLMQCEPEYDCVMPALARKALLQAKCVVALTSYDNEHFREYADVLLPITPISEMSGTYINAFGKWQGFEPAVTPLGESRPGWKVLRVLANVWETEHFHYESEKEVLDELNSFQNHHSYYEDDLLNEQSLTFRTQKEKTQDKLIRLAPTPLYAVDGITRRANALQETHDGKVNVVKLNSVDARSRNLFPEQPIVIVQGDAKSRSMRLEIDDNIPVGAAWVPGGIIETITLGAPFDIIDIIAHEEKMR